MLNHFYIMKENAGHLIPLNEGRFELIEHLIPWLNEMDSILD